MPFSPKFDKTWKCIRDALNTQELRVSCKRADDFHSPHILESIVKGIKEADFIIADLTEANPNVFYELGFTHCHKGHNKAVLLTQDLKWVPFDVKHLRCIIYKDTSKGLGDLRKKLIETFSEYLQSTFELTVNEKSDFDFGRKLAGDDDDLFSIHIKNPYVGHDSVKMEIIITRHSLNNRKNVKSQLVYLSDHHKSEKIEFIPWSLDLVGLKDEQAYLRLQRNHE